MNDAQTEVEHHKNLEATLREVMELLDRQALVHQLVSRADTRKPELAQSLVERQHAAELQKKLNRLHPADVAFVLESLNQEQRRMAWQLVDRDRRGAILLELSDPVRASLLTLLEDIELVALGRQMEGEEFAELLQELPKERIDQILSQLGSRERAEVQAVLSFPEGTVGSLMQLDVVTVREDITLDDAIASLRRRSNLPEQFTTLVVVDRNNVLRGVLPLDRLLTHDGALRVADVMDANPTFFHTSDSVDDAAQAFERYDLMSAPVLNQHRQVVGLLTVDDVLGYVSEDTFKASLSQVGLSEDEDLFAPILSSGRKRWAWLVLNLMTAFIASRVVGAFEESIGQLAALAALMPIVASIGGNTGNQTVALVIRALALSQLNRSNLPFLLKKELAIGLINGLILGLLMAAATLVLYGSVPLAGVMLASMVLNMLLAAVVGVFCPIVLDRLGRDPVRGSSILLTATTDTMGFLIFLGLATWVLL